MLLGSAAQLLGAGTDERFDLGSGQRKETCGLGIVADMIQKAGSAALVLVNGAGRKTTDVEQMIRIRRHELLAGC